MTSIKQLLQWGVSHLQQSSDSARLDAEILLCHCLKKERAYLFTYPEQGVDEPTLSTYQSFIEQRLGGYPIAYIIGKKSFWSMTLTVNEHTLIPRPETEQLVEMALEHIKSIINPKIIDLGTGSGAIALAIASERPDACIIASDISFEAIQVAQTNQQQYQLNQVRFICMHWLSALASQHQFDLIVSNPPYIAANAPHLQSDIRYEPRQALISGQHGLDDIQHIISTAKACLKSGGKLILEHGYDQKNAIAHYFKAQQFTGINCRQDMAGIDRITEATWDAFSS